MAETLGPAELDITEESKPGMTGIDVTERSGTVRTELEAISIFAIRNAMMTEYDFSG